MTADAQVQEDRARGQSDGDGAHGRPGRDHDSRGDHREGRSETDGTRERSRGDDGDRQGVGSGRRGLVDVARAAVGEFVELTGLTPERLSGARPEKDGCSFLLDVTELDRIPPSSSVMATYRVDVDQEGHVIQYERLRRFHRSATDQT
ncbi:gas vesicle protein GvpO [Micromonospora sp. NPDC047740]|uniref:gas vesicle protein GvpO n=1 Tax=Micromonospora sp. NPDC047740 TaxID=3364254 RepID=UPI0037135F70